MWLQSRQDLKDRDGHSVLMQHVHDGQVTAIAANQFFRNLCGQKENDFTVQETRSERAMTRAKRRESRETRRTCSIRTVLLVVVVNLQTRDELF